MSMSILAAAEEDAIPDANSNVTSAQEPPTISDEQNNVDTKTVIMDNSATTDNSTTLTDPAILEVKSLIRYTHQNLLSLKDSPLSVKRPDYLNPAFNGPSGIWDPELWHRSRSDTPSENGVRADPPELHKRRSGDPRERIRKEQDGIVLSPQRRSFNSGCFVPLKENQRANRPHSPLGKSENSHIPHREISTGTRRIGSGRILSREVPWDFQEKSEPDNDYNNYRRDRREIDRDESRFERRTFTRDFEVTKDKDKQHGGPRNNNGRYNERRRIASDNRDEEPEWFSGGPVSQHETIELRGFDDIEIDRGNKKKLSAAQKKKLKERLIKNAETQPTDNKERQDSDKDMAITEKASQQDSSATANRRSPAVEIGGSSGDGQDKTKPSIDGSINDQNFNLDEILNTNTIAGLLSNGVTGEEGENSGSRFSKWFKKDSPVKQQLSESRRSSLQEEHIIKNLLNEISEPNVTIPTDSDLYFTPISPAANTGNFNMRQRNNVQNMYSFQKPLTLIEMLHRQKPQSEINVKLNDVPPSKLLSLEELEARMMHQGSGDPGAAARAMSAAQNKPMPQKPEEDALAFKRLLAHAVSNNVPVSNKPPMSILEMLSHSQQQDEAARLAAAAQLMGPASPNPMSNSHDIAFMKLQQVQNHAQAQQRQQSQMEMLSKLMQRQQLGASPLPEMCLSQSRELLSRPEAQAILQGLKRGDITPQHLHQQLAANHAMQPRHRELLFTILKLHGNGGAGVGPSPRVLSPVPPHPLFQQQQQQQQQQQLRVSPLPNAYCVSPILAPSPNALTVPALHQRIPSPRELQVHTQNIMQRALIKKKLEEQQENFKKRQEMQQRGQSPGRGLSPPKNTSSPTPLAFTPTSVLRKMTADKDDSSKDGSKLQDPQGKLPQGRPVMGLKATLQNQQWNAPQPKQPAGRPIVKANANLQSNQSAIDQAQFYNQQQQQQQQRLYGSQQSKKMGSQFMNHSQHPGAPSQQSSLSHFSHPQSMFSTNPQQFQQLTQHQLRAQHQQHQPPLQKSQFNNQQNHQALHWSQQQQMLMGHNFDGRGSHMGERGSASNNGGDLSPTSNQLARWFSPELLERARAGKVPHMPSLTNTQNAISLEEIERQTAPPVHN